RQRVGPSLRGHRSGVEDLDFAPDSRRLASVGDDGTRRLRTIEAGLGRKAWQATVMNDVVWGVRFDPSGTMVASASEDGTIRLWDAARGVMLGKPLADLEGDVLAVAFTPDGHGLVAGNGKGEIYGWTVPAGTPVFDPVRNAHSSDVWKLAFSPKGDRFATASSDGTSVVLEWPTGRIVGRAFSRDGRRMAAGDDTGVVEVWRLGTSEEPTALLGHKHQVWALAFSPDGSLMASGDRGGQVNLWNLADGTLQRSIAADDSPIWSLAFTPDGRTLVTASDRRVQTWDAGTGALRHALPNPGGSITRATLSPDGALVATASSDGRVRLWDLAKATPVKELVVDDDV